MLYIVFFVRVQCSLGATADRDNSGYLLVDARPRNNKSHTRLPIVDACAKCDIRREMRSRGPCTFNPTSLVSPLVLPPALPLARTRADVSCSMKSHLLTWYVFFQPFPLPGTPPLMTFIQVSLDPTFCATRALPTSYEPYQWTQWDKSDVSTLWDMRAVSGRCCTSRPLSFRRVKPTFRRPSFTNHSASHLATDASCTVFPHLPLLLASHQPPPHTFTPQRRPSAARFPHGNLAGA